MAQERWSAPCAPAGTARRPEGLPPCGTDATGHNRASRWLLRRGWWSLRHVARLYNVKRSWLRRQAEAGRITFLRVGQHAYFCKGVDVKAGFAKLGDPGTYLAWIDNGCPLERE